MRSESCASNPRLDNSSITRRSPDGVRAFGFLPFLPSAVSLIAQPAGRVAPIRRSSNRAHRRLRAADSYCAGAVPAGGVAAGFSPVRRPWRRSWRPCRRSLRWVRRPCRRCIPWVPVAGAGAAAGAAASCASASSGSSADDSVKPSAAPSPSRESAFRREIISILASSFISSLPVTHDRPNRRSSSRSNACNRPSTGDAVGHRLAFGAPVMSDLAAST